jgi:hypothetical protein
VTHRFAGRLIALSVPLLRRLRGAFVAVTGQPARGCEARRRRLPCRQEPRTRGGKSLNFTNDTGPASHGSGNTVETTVALSKDKYRIGVRPEGEPEFETVVKVSDRDFPPPQYPFRPRTALIVLFDPDDHQRVAIDVAATWAKWEALTEKKAKEQATESALAAAQTAPATPDVTEQLTRLGDLRDRGILTEQEFAAEKAKLLAAS